jgi:hypothetical protein
VAEVVGQHAVNAVGFVNANACVQMRARFVGSTSIEDRRATRPDGPIEIYRPQFGGGSLPLSSNRLNSFPFVIKSMTKCSGSVSETLFEWELTS